MTHLPSTSAEANLIAAAVFNLKSTYLTLALAGPRTQRWQFGNFEGCEGEFQHPICNFAITSSVNLDDLQRVKALANQKLKFHIYLMPGPAHDVAREAILRHDFRALYGLDLMVADEPESVPGELEISPALTQLDRDRVGVFMADQFFSRQPLSDRQAIASATSKAESLQLLAALGGDRKVEAAVMLGRTEETGPLPPTLGIYNLCVDAQQRGRRIGSSLVRAVVSAAVREQRVPTLQCDPPLTEWYQNLGFRSISRVEAFGL